MSHHHDLQIVHFRNICAQTSRRHARPLGSYATSCKLFTYAGGPQTCFSKVPDRRIDFLPGPAGSRRAIPGMSSVTSGISWDLSHAGPGDRAPRSFPRTKMCVAREADGIAMPFEDACFDPERSRVSIDSLSFIDRIREPPKIAARSLAIVLSHAFFVNFNTS